MLKCFKLIVIIKIMNTIHLKNIDLNLLLVFDSIYREKSLTLAGERLGRTQSAMSHALERLRTLFGDRLFVRTARRMRPTPRAEGLAAPIQKALTSLQEAFAVPEKFTPESLSRTFRFSMSDYCETVILPRLMEFLGRKAPGIQIEVLSPAASNPQRGLESGRFELIIGNRDLGSGILSRRLWCDTFVCLVGSSCESTGRGMTLDAYLRHPHVLFAPRGKKDRIVEKTLAKLGIKRKIALKTPSITVVSNIIKNSRYIVTLPRKMAESIQSPSLDMLEPPVAFPELPVMQYWHEASHEDPAHKWLRETIHDFFSEAL